METLYYIWEVLCQAWPVILLMGMIAVPILWMWLEDNNEFEDLNKYYPSADDENQNKEDICDK